MKSSSRGIDMAKARVSGPEPTWPTRRQELRLAVEGWNKISSRFSMLLVFHESSEEMGAEFIADRYGSPEKLAEASIDLRTKAVQLGYATAENGVSGFEIRPFLDAWRCMEIWVRTRSVEAKVGFEAASIEAAFVVDKIVSQVAKGPRVKLDLEALFKKRILAAPAYHALRQSGKGMTGPEIMRAIQSSTHQKHVSKDTLNEALDLLSKEGYIANQKSGLGRGYYIVDPDQKA